MKTTLAEQICKCVEESIHSPYEGQEYTKQEKIETLAELISLLEWVKNNIEPYHL